MNPHSHGPIPSHQHHSQQPPQHQHSQQQQHYSGSHGVNGGLTAGEGGGNSISTGGTLTSHPLPTSTRSEEDDDVKPNTNSPLNGQGKKGGGIKRNKVGGGGGAANHSISGGGGTGSGGDSTTKDMDGGEVKYDKDGNPKKKRKQLVACDSCRLRRVKCDRSEKMGGPCSECEKKKITCTDTYVKNKPKTVRSGKLIQQAKALYGDDPMKPTLSPPAAESTTDSTTSRPSATATEQTSPRPPPRQDLVHLSSAQSRLVHSQITRDISSELVATFFSVLHQICPLVDRDQFEIAWNLAGQVAENLTPANECLAAVLQAWASKISDNPLIVGYGVPTLDEIRKDGESAGGGGADYTLVGNRREDFAQAMKERALRLVDEKGLLRISSGAAASALTLLEFLVTFDDTSRVKTRGRYLMVGACEHLRNLNNGHCDDMTEPLVTPERLSGGTLLWMVYTRDALVALIAGRYACFTEDELTSLCDLFTNPITADPLPYISSNDARMLSGLAVASMFRHVVACVRTTITLLTSPLARRSKLQESSLNQMWSEIDTSSRFTSIFQQSVDATDFGGDAPAKSHVWFRDLIGIKGQHILGLHVMICQRLDEEEARVTKEGGSHSEEDGSETYLSMLRRVKEQSDERFLQVSREWTAMTRTYGTEILFSAFFTIEYTRDYLHHMVESPAWEQGGSADYTWANKVDECGALMEIMQTIGWAWAGLDRHIHQARHSLARQGHRIQEHQQQLAQQQRQRHQSYPQQQQPYHPSNDLYPPSTQAWSGHSHAHTISHPPLPSNPVPLPAHSFATTVSIPAPSLSTYYESNTPELGINYGPTAYPSSSTDTNVPPTSLPPPQANGLTSYTGPQSILSPTYQHSSSTNSAFYHYHQQSQPTAPNGGGPPGFDLTGSSNGGGGGPNGYVESSRGPDEISRLPSMTYGTGSI